MQGEDVGGSWSQGASQDVGRNTQVPAALQRVVSNFLDEMANFYSARAQATFESSSDSLQEKLSSLGRDHLALIQSTTQATHQHQEDLRVMQERVRHEHATVVRVMGELDTANAALRVAQTAISASTSEVTAANAARDAAVLASNTARDAAVFTANAARDAAVLALGNMTARLMAMITGVAVVAPAADTATGQGAPAAGGGDGAQ
jgi:hypothetical protein